MEIKDLLEQEEEFHKLNAELELRTRQLMKNVEESINKASADTKHWPPVHWSDTGVQGCNKFLRTRGKYTMAVSPESSFVSDDPDQSFFSDYTLSDQRLSRSRSALNNRPNRSNSIIKQFTSKDLESGDLIPATAKGMSAESLARFLKAKGKLLQEELAQTKRDFNSKSDEYRKVQQELRNTEEEKHKLQGEVSSLREKVKKLEINLNTFTERLQMRDSENTLLKKEVNMLKCDMKKMIQNSSGHDLRLNKAKEEIERLKQQLKQSQSSEKEMRDTNRKKQEELLNSLRKLEKQKNELITAIKKQISLIENLKQQKKHYLETNEMKNLKTMCDKEHLKRSVEEIEEELKSYIDKGCLRTNATAKSSELH